MQCCFEGLLCCCCTRSAYTNHFFNVVIHAWRVRVIARERFHSLDPRMSLVKEFENFGPQRGWNDHTFPEQDTSLLDHEGISASVEAFELDKSSCWQSILRSGQRDFMNFFTVCSSVSFSVLEQSLSKVTRR